MSKYVIWDTTSNVITPVGEVLSAEQWMNRYPVARILPIVCAGGAINGAFFGVYSTMVETYAKQGCDFTGCETEQDHLDRIEEFEDAINNTVIVSDTERIASALEFQNMLALEDVSEEGV